MFDRNKILNWLLILVAISGVLMLVIFGVLFLRQKLSGGAPSQVDLEAKRQQELTALNKALDELRATDADLDGLSAEQEKQYGTDPEKSDTDNDGILDKTEIETWKTDPLKDDTDGDGYKDGYEARRDLDPLKKDK